MDMAWDMVMVDTTDHGDMATGDERRGPLTMKPVLLVPTPMLTLMPMLTTAIGVAMEDGDWDMVMVDTTDLGDMATGDARRGPLTSQPSLDLIPMPMLMLGTDTMATPGHGDMDMVDTTDHGDMDTGAGSKRFSSLVALGTGTLCETTSTPGQ